MGPQSISVQAGDTVVLASSYTPRHNGVPALAVRTFVRMLREPAACGRAACDALCGMCREDGAYWHDPAPFVELSYGRQRPTVYLPLVTAPDTRRGLIARLRRENAEKTAARAARGGSQSGRVTFGRLPCTERDA